MSLSLVSEPGQAKLADLGQPAVQPLRVLHFAQDSDTSGFFPQLARWHDRERFRMYFGTLNPTAPWLREYMLSHGIPCFSCQCRGRKSFPAGLVRLARYLRQEHIDILHTHLFEPSVVGLAAGTLARTPHRVMTRHYSDYHTRIHKRIHVRIDQTCNHLSHAIIAVSEHTAAHLIDVEGANRRKVFAVANGIDFDRVKLSSPEAPGRLRRELTPNNERLLVMVGRFHPEKGYDYILPALVELNRILPRPVVLAVAGAGPLQGHYEDMACRLGCAGRVRFLGFRKDVADLMAAADLVVHPAVAEAFGLVLTEALYLGTPVVATRVGGIPEIVTDGCDGVLVPPADSAALVHAIAELLTDSEHRQRLAHAGSAQVQERFRFENMVRKYEVIYEQLARHRAGRAGHA
jgi:glycosyltransferase involved in cell wall biosynthesis